MKKHNVILLVVFCFLILFSCNEPETVVTNYVHRDGSVTRLIEMRSTEKKFDVCNVQVPYDSTWQIKDTIEIPENGKDTVWVRKAEKAFISIDELNHDYIHDSSHNAAFRRSASFKKEFKWFHTTYRFSEKVDRIMEFGLPLNDFLTEDEMKFFYSPGYAFDEPEDSPDSLHIRKMKEAVESNIETWIEKSLISEWIGQFGKIAGEGAGPVVNELKARETEIFDDLTNEYNEKFDSLWDAGILQKKYMGSGNAEKFKDMADSALKITASSVSLEFGEYTLKTVMPGQMVATNGYIDSSGVVLWPVISDYIITEPYEMWTESRVTNVWAWVLSGFFLLFVITGVIIKQKKG
ncbi:MAG TPA: hypothetical protein VK213_09210 [Bacteroidales bacterium]|nr:hypothetical protein [Bacteroidales bacterium]